jgi:hypothetical protein
MSIWIIFWLCFLASPILFVSLCINARRISSTSTTRMPPVAENRFEFERQRRAEFLESRRYHNEKIYENFKQFTALMLALMAGVGVLLTKSNEFRLFANDETLRETASVVVALSGYMFAALLVGHQCSKIKREPSARRWFEHLFIIECLMFSAIVTVSTVVALIVLPHAFQLVARP